MRLPIEKLLAAAAALAISATLLAGVRSMRAPAATTAQDIVLPAPTTVAPRAAPTHPGTAHSETIVFAGGCFWGVQGVFQHVEGVQRAVSGYIGGAAATAHYETVGSGRSGHAEAVQVTYDPARIGYAQLLQVFFAVAHDPTQRDRQGPDRGTQYRSAVFATTPEQVQATRAYIAQLDKAGVFGAPIATTVDTGKTFYPAEAYHQDYLAQHPDSAYIRAYDLPKLRRLERLYPALYRAQPVLLTQR